MDEVWSYCDANMLDKQDPFGQIENGGRIQAVYSNKQDDEKRTEWIESGRAEQGTEKRIGKFRLKTNIKEKKTETEHREKQRNR